MIKSTESDWNRDGKLDFIDIDLEIPLQDNEVIYGVQLYMLFDVKLYVRFYFLIGLLLKQKTSSFISEIQPFPHARLGRGDRIYGIAKHRNKHQWRP